MDKFNLLMVLHSHQPVGNFDHVFAYAVERCYRPVLEILARYPEFRCGLHYSGPLLSWLEANDPGFLDAVKELADRGQVEMLSGGFYEPLLASIPQRDAVAQVDKLTAYTSRRFGQKPTGFWLAERIWEPSIPIKLAACGLKYTIVDDTHLYYAGLGASRMFGYHLTEREGRPLALFPTHKELRYTIPFKEPALTLDFLRRTFDEIGPSCATYGDDTEKFGLWPGTYDWVIKKGWLTRFIETVLKASDWLSAGLPGEYLNENPPAGRVYPPTAAYEEMLTWALPSDTSLEMERLIKQLEAEGRYEQMRKFLRGGLWDNFLVKYRESNLMHKRMLYISRKLLDAGASAEAFDHLYQAQCNCAYWHGLFGGLYLGHLRHAVHQHLIAAESISDQVVQGRGSWASCEVQDIDIDGHEEVLMAGPHLDAVVHPGYGGSISVLDLRPQGFNLAGALTRRPEAYHAHFAEAGKQEEDGGEVKSIHEMVVFKEKDLDKYLIYDWYERGSFQDHLLPPMADLQGFIRADYHEWGDFINQPYELKHCGAENGRAFCRLQRDGSIWAPGGPWPLTIEKDYALGPGARLEAAYAIKVVGEATPAPRFGVELNFSLLAADDPAKRIETGGRILRLNKPEQAQDVAELFLVNEQDGFTIKFTPSRPASVWCFPVETVSQSESGLERTYQGSSLTFIWDLPAGAKTHELGLGLEVF